MQTQKVRNSEKSHGTVAANLLDNGVEYQRVLENMLAEVAVKLNSCRQTFNLNMLELSFACVEGEWESGL